MNALIEQFGTEDFFILGFPCNQFGMQEPGGNDTEIMDGIRFVRPGKGFVPFVTLMKKIEVNGPNQHPLYEWLKSRCDPPELSFQPKEKLFYEGLHTHDIRWNWAKFLIRHDGIPYKRYAPSVRPSEIVPDIVRLTNALHTARKAGLRQR